MSSAVDVAGCQHPTVAEIVNGSFTLFAENHGRPAFRKDTLVKGVEVLLYFWDARDGPIFSGWWFGPKVGGDEVWAHNPDASAPTPPPSGWKVPCNGPVDPAFVVVPRLQALAQMLNQFRQQPVMQQLGRQKGGGTGGTGAQVTLREVEQARYRELEDKKKQIEENKRKVMEARLQALVAERQRREEESRRRQEEFVRRQEEFQTRQVMQRLEQEQRIKEGRAMMAIRMAIQKLRIATPDNFEESTKELDDIMAVELGNCTDASARMVHEEACMCLEGTRARVQAIRDQLRREQEERERIAREQAEREAKAKALVLELQRMVGEADAACQALKDAIAALDIVERPIREETEDALQAAVDSENMARERVKACNDFIVRSQPELSTVLPDPALAAREVALKAAVERRRKELEAQAVAEAKALNGGAVAEEAPATEAPQEQEKDLRTLLGELMNALTETKKEALIAGASLPDVRERVMRKVVATERTVELETTFKRYDKDRDGVLNRLEVAAYARGEFRYSVPKPALEKILESLSESGQAGVGEGSLVLLRCAVGISRQMQLGQRLRTERLEREKLLATVRRKFFEDIRAVSKQVEAAELEMAKVEDLVNPLGKMVSRTGIREMYAVAARVEEVLKKSGRPVRAARKAVEDLFLGFEERLRDDLRTLYKSDAVAKRMEVQTLRFNARIARAENLLDRFRLDALRKESSVVTELKAAVFAVLRHNKRVKGQSSEDFFDVIDIDHDGSIDVEDFVKFFATADRGVRVKTVKKPIARAKVQAAPLKMDHVRAEVAPAAAIDGSVVNGDGDEEEVEKPMKLPTLDDDALRLIFPKLLQDGAEEISKDAFVSLVMLRYVVLQRTTLTDRLGIDGHEVVAELEEGDVVEVCEGPIRDVATGIWRVRARSFKDGAVGWVTVRGNRGGTFLREGGLVYKIVKETILTDCFDPSEKLEGHSEPKKLKVGEVLDVLEGPLKEEKTKLTRLRAKLRSDGSQGWVTLRGNTGAVFARAVLP